MLVNSRESQDVFCCLWFGARVFDAKVDLRTVFVTTRCAPKVKDDGIFTSPVCRKFRKNSLTLHEQIGLHKYFQLAEVFFSLRYLLECFFFLEIFISAAQQKRQCQSESARATALRSFFFLLRPLSSAEKKKTLIFTEMTPLAIF